MLSKEGRDIISSSRERGWIMEPDAKRLLAMAGLRIPKNLYTNNLKQAIRFAREVGYPVVAKVVSPQIVHKSDVKGVMTDIKDDETLKNAFERFKLLDGFSGVLVEETISGIELIIGAKVDYQFGPVILLGIGGTGVEIYKDTSIKMAPLKKEDVDLMLLELRGRKIIQGHRGSEPVNREALVGTILNFSELVMELEEEMESIDLNPVICNTEDCIVADARIILSRKK